MKKSSIIRPIKKWGIIMNKIKTYFPMVLSSLFLLVYTTLMILVFTNKMYKFDNEPLLMATFFIIIILFIIEWIYFMINAATNKKVDNKGLWVFLIYMLNVFVIPYYNFKYNGSENDLTNNVLIYIIISLICIIIGFIIAI